MRRRLILSAIFVSAIVSACTKAPEDKFTNTQFEVDRKAQLSMFEAEAHKHTAELSSDKYEGRAPATPGEEKTLEYLKTQFESLGLTPGNSGSFFQEVPIAQISTFPKVTLNIEGKAFQRALKYRTEMMLSTMQQVDQTGIENSELIFVGYGVVAPEYSWNDYEGIDVEGKTVVILVNDPGYIIQDEKYFNGNAMTYYGRWSYKFEEAARQGAAAAIIIHQTGAAGYPWAVVSGSWSGPQTTLSASDKNIDRCEIEGWIQLEVARDLFAAAGLDLDEQMKAAATPGFKAVPLNLRASAQLYNAIKSSTSRNVIALLPGSERPDELIIYTAHWDHLGKNPVMDGDNIYNGALDNATGVGGLLGLAKAFSELPSPPQRSILFLAATAEESGLLGSKYYAENPIYPLADSVAVLNMDSMAINGRMKDVVVIGYGSSELENYLESAAQKQNRFLAREPTPEKGYYYRSDHFSMAKFGVPALYAKAGIEHIQHGAEWTKQRNAEYITKNYHKPSDEYNPNWNLEGAAEDIQLYFDVGHALANEATFPNWYEGNEFRAIRDSSRASKN